MSMNQKIARWARSRLFRRYFFLFALLLIGFLITALIYTLSNLEHSRLQKGALQEQIEQKGEKLNELRRLHLIDSLIVEGQLDQARQALDDQPEVSARLNNWLSAQIQRKEQQRKQARSDSQRLALTKDQQLSTIHNLEDSLQDLHALHRHHRDSVQKAISAQNQKIKELEEKLAAPPEKQFISFYNSKGNKVYYMGETQEGKAHGEGIGIWRTGSRYEGEWKANKRHGEGVFEWKDGERYEGQYRNDMRHGQGTYYWSNGEKFQGEWQNDQRNGQGTFYDRDGNVLAKGKWRDDELVRNKKEVD